MAAWHAYALSRRHGSRLQALPPNTRTQRIFYRYRVCHDRHTPLQPSIDSVTRVERRLQSSANTAARLTRLGRLTPARAYG